VDYQDHCRIASKNKDIQILLADDCSWLCQRRAGLPARRQKTVGGGVALIGGAPARSGADECIKVAIATLLAPRELGFGVTKGVETAVRAARCYVDNMQ
jgi:hypothetical protein